MNSISPELARLREGGALSSVLESAPDREAAAELASSRVAFASADGALESAWLAALGLLFRSTRPSPAGGRMLIEGEDYKGCWLESTGSISAEVLSRFCPGLAESTFLSFARLARGDGLLPYKVTEAGPAYRQAQMVTPLARSVWKHCALNSAGADFVELMYGAMRGNDEWLAAKRDTRGSGCVEAFCAFDTGHDLSPRFWHLPDTCFREDPSRCDPDYPALPYLAPDMTANVYCQRLYLARLARSLGRDIEARVWEAQAARSLESLVRECYDEEDCCFYDRDASGRPVRLQSDVLLRVLACGVGDSGLFDRALERYLLNPRKFFAKYPPTSVAMDDPRFDRSFSRNSWAGPTNLLSLIRSPEAFESRSRYAELVLYMRPALAALSRARSFPQCLDPWSGEAGYGTGYTPAALCLLDFVERMGGILPLPEGGLRFSSLGEADCAYARKLGDRVFELESGPELARVFMDGREILSFPAGLHVFADAEGRPLRAANARPRKMAGTLVAMGIGHRFEAESDQAVESTI